MEYFSPYSAKGLHNRVLSIFKKLHLHKNSDILDFGCGNGSLLHDFHKLGYENLFGCDGYIANDALYDIARFDKINFNGGVSIYDKDTFDLITMVEVIEHLENANSILKDLYTILKKDGRLLITTPNTQTLLSRILFFFEGNPYCFRKGDAKFSGFPGHINPIFPHILQEIFKDFFRIEKIYYGDFIVPFLGKSLPIRNKLFGHNIILVLRKI